MSEIQEKENLMIRVLEAFGLTVVLRVPQAEDNKTILLGEGFKVTVEAFREDDAVDYDIK